MRYNAFRYHAISPNKADETSQDQKKPQPILTPMVVIIYHGCKKVSEWHVTRALGTLLTLA